MHARKLNLLRRHLNQDQRRELIRDQLKSTPERSDRHIAMALGVSDKTVGSVRKQLVEGAEIPHHKTIIGADGVQQPRERKPKTVSAQRDSQESHGGGHKVSTVYIPQDTKEVLEAARIVRKERLAEDRERREVLKAEALKMPLPEGRYRTIVVDPPWQMERIQRDLKPNGFGFDYATMDLDEIGNYPVPDFAHEQCHLYLWVTQKHLWDARRILEDWGFNHIFTMIWRKNGGFQPYGLPQFNAEFILFGRRGKLDFLETKQFFVCFDAPRREHSRKPNEFYDLVRRLSPAPRIDVFSRERHEGFDQHGNETDFFTRESA